MIIFCIALKEPGSLLSNGALRMMYNYEQYYSVHATPLTQLSPNPVQFKIIVVGRLRLLFA